MKRPAHLFISGRTMMAYKDNKNILYTAVVFYRLRVSKVNSGCNITESVCKTSQNKKWNIYGKSVAKWKFMPIFITTKLVEMLESLWRRMKPVR